ncbi:UDP-forming cellulose synthase catalytic subunit [Castellaniella defragrans]|uniref:Cellulose synthase catalytic subunit [UDP-forming] n=2 Tax=Castellaniella defragrans TaxID=75697 RepID=W8X0N1_CASD6|nr:UDP-forming cellulose synthase catalytic subunit [Castellaniella defragrans]MBB6083311.1 cellulose synthase (UDP-forming) [Castellaniella defragrans]CDM25459.1 Cellulose synthase catalytic subunit [UDP-forming] [Castellaniella defragrans 65Phen]
MVDKVGAWWTGLPVWRPGWVQLLALMLVAVLGWFVVTTYLDLVEQAVFGILVFCVAFVLNRASQSRLITLAMMSISVAASLRYMYWRVTQSLGFESWWDASFGYGLLLAEFYALTVLLLSYFQSAWPLHRKPVMLPADTRLWPSVDVYIPTYNESLSVVRQTVLAALSMDWPADRMNVYVLDDGRRPEFRDFCARVRVGYLTREDNRHAKAGNINAALPRTDGEFIAVFDCDHVPTRSFLQVCMGWFLKDPKLAMLQTPHVFFSPDPLENNLEVFHNVPNEGQLFYGLTQDGNDLWNATFYCGSCAVLRREHLLAVGGMAVESVTEDALTALKMNKLDLNTAYLAIPQAAGLATENLSRHINQRIRWARGMAQIFRRYNPLFSKGLSISQRVCYASAALHFFYSLPRLVFLTAPLAYLFFGARVFDASALMVVVYAGPHILHAQLTNYRVQGKFRHSFWNEVYESVLAWYLMRPTLAAVIDPASPVFNVTAKGGTSERAYFDWRLARPYIILLLLNAAGMIVGTVMLVQHVGDAGVFQTILLNMGWTFLNLVVCSASVAVAGERRQIRSSPRVLQTLDATVALPGGHRIRCQTSDFSQDGLGLVLPQELPLSPGQAIKVSLYRGREERVFPAIVRFCRGQRLGLYFEGLSIAQQVELVQLTFARANIWAEAWHASAPDSPLEAIRQIGRIGGRGFGVLLRESGRELGRLLRRRPGPMAETPAAQS